MQSCNISPRLFGVRLTATIECANFIKHSTSELRYFCGQGVCKESIFGGYYEREEYTLWPALFDNPFKMYQDSNNKYTLALLIL